MLDQLINFKNRIVIRFARQIYQHLFYWDALACALIWVAVYFAINFSVYIVNISFIYLKSRDNAAFFKSIYEYTADNLTFSILPAILFLVIEGGWLLKKDIPHKSKNFLFLLIMPILLYVYGAISPEIMKNYQLTDQHSFFIKVSYLAICFFCMLLYKTLLFAQSQEKQDIPGIERY